MAHEFNVKMAAQIDAAIPVKGILTSRQVAETLHEELLTDDPALLHGWLRANAVQFLTDVIGQRLRSERGRYRNTSRRAFGDAAEVGDLSNYFEQRFVIDDGNSWKKLGDMTGVDHKYVASQYERSAKTDALLAKFHVAVARKVGAKRTDEVFTAEQLYKLEQSILGI
jgi:hypothetical protein